MKNILLTVFIALTTGFSLAFILSIRSCNQVNAEKNILIDRTVELVGQIERLESVIDSLKKETGSKEVVYHARDFRTKDFFTFLKIGRGYTGYEIISDIKEIDRTAFDFVFWVCVDSGIDIPFLMHVLWSESRMGTNIKHRKNNDGSIDGGWFGINYKSGRVPLNRTPYTDVFAFIKKYRILEKYPKDEWPSRYNSKVLWIK